jgi:hypothetical protein
MEQACSRVLAVKRLLRAAMATVDRDILHPIQASLKKRKVELSASDSLRVLLHTLTINSIALVLGHC